MSRTTRRQWIGDTGKVMAGAGAAGMVASSPSRSAEEKDGELVNVFFGNWMGNSDPRVWLGPEFWANPMQDWRVHAGRIECLKAAPDRNVHVLTRQLGAKEGNFWTSVEVGRLEGGSLSKTKGSAGFRIGIRGPIDDYRNAVCFGKGLDAGFNSKGELFIGDTKSKPIKLETEFVQLRLDAAPGKKGYDLTLGVTAEAKKLGEVVRKGVPGAQLVGNIALVANFGAGKRNAATDRFWFRDWALAGAKLEVHDERVFGPIFFIQYTLSNGTLKLTAQMPPMGPRDHRPVLLQIKKKGVADWVTIAEEKIHPDARTATFRIKDWNDKVDIPYRLAYTVTSKGTAVEYYWAGTIRHDPVERDELKVSDISCNIHAAFPNAPYVANVGKLDPDLLAFVGDQFYESTGGYGVVRRPRDPAILDYLRKWYFHGWTWRELMKDRPSISIPDDHDVYQGNIWGMSGAPQTKTQEAGGYNMMADWVNVVHRTQTSHHPDPYDDKPIHQNISVYYGPMTYGRVSFAILADRMFKTAPEGRVPPTGGRGDHVKDPNFDPKTADLKGLVLLGDRQMKFLEDWAADWKGADMKAVISQTIFAAMATTHGGGRERLRADYDANGWPQTERNNALRAMRKAFAVHLAGDQHLPAVVHYGVDEPRDAGVAFAGPAVNVGYPRWWEPKEPGKNRAPKAPEITGDFVDHFGNLMAVLAVKNGAVKPRRPVLEHLQDKASGHGLVRFYKKKQTIIIECWPFLADPSKPDPQFPGWPITVKMEDNYGRKPTAHLPTLAIEGTQNPVVQVINEANNEVEYTLRIAGSKYQPGVFAAGKYTVVVSQPDAGQRQILKGLEAAVGNKKTISVKL